MAAALGGAMVGALALAGCQTLDLDWRARAPEGGGAAVVSDPAEDRLFEAVESARAAQVRLAEIRSAQLRPVVEIPDRTTPELLQRVTLDWLGPIERVAEKLADEIGYDFVVFGRRPPVPVMVEVNAKDEPVIFVLQDVGVQAEARAHLTVHAGRMIVRLDWLDGAAAPARAPAEEDGS